MVTLVSNERIVPPASASTRLERVRRYLRRYWFVYLLALPGVLHVFIFRYIPMYGIIIAFKDYKFIKGVAASPWVGFKHFRKLFSTPYFWQVVKNTVYLNVVGLVLNTVVVIGLALLLNEMRCRWAKRSIQTAIYLPHFLSWVVFAGLINVVLSPSDGIVNNIIVALGGKPIYFLGNPDTFRPVLILSGLIKGAGYSTIIYLSAMAGINPALYESAVIDGANRGQMMWHITLPRIKPTICVLTILSLVSLFSSNFDQVYNLYSPLVYETGDVISTYLYRSGMQEGKLDLSTAMGLMFSVFSFLMIIITNQFLKKMDVMGIM